MRKSRSNAVDFHAAPSASTITIVIPVCHDPEGLKETLLSLKGCTPIPLSVEIIVANDGGDAEVVRACERHAVKSLSISPRQGSYFARMTGVEHSSGVVIAFLDAGVVVSSSWLDAVHRATRSADYVGGPIRISVSGKTRGAHYYEQSVAFRVRSSINNAGFAPTANLVVARHVFDRIGGFDRRLKSGGDREFGQRVRDSKRFRQRFAPHAIVTHPARGFRKMVRKIDRVQAGKVMLSAYYPSRFRSERPGFFNIAGKLVFPPVAFVRASRALPISKRLAGLGVAILFGLRSFTSYVKYASRSPKSADFENR